MNNQRHADQLLPPGIGNKIPDLYSQEEVQDPIVWVKFFNPYGSGTWLITEWDKKDTMFGYADLGFGGGELGYISLSEIRSLKKFGKPQIERDMYFKPKPLSQAKRENRMASQETKTARIPKGDFVVARHVGLNMTVLKVFTSEANAEAYAAKVGGPPEKGSKLGDQNIGVYDVSPRGSWELIEGMGGRGLALRMRTPRHSSSVRTAGISPQGQKVQRLVESWGESFDWYDGYSGRGMFGKVAPIAFTSGLDPRSEKGQKILDLGFDFDTLGQGFIYYARNVGSLKLAAGIKIAADSKWGIYDNPGWERAEAEIDRAVDAAKKYLTSVYQAGDPLELATNMVGKTLNKLEGFGTTDSEVRYAVQDVLEGHLKELMKKNGVRYESNRWASGRVAATFNFNVPVGPVHVGETAARLNKDPSIKAEAGTEHVYGTVQASDKDEAATKLNAAAGWATPMIADRDIGKSIRMANTTPTIGTNKEATMNGNDTQLRKALIRTASQMPKGPDRKALLDLIAADKVAEGCPDNLPQGTPGCDEWEENTEKYKDVVKDMHKNANSLRNQLIRTAAAMPKGTQGRKALLDLIAGCEKLPNEAMQENCEKKKEEGAKADK